MDTMDKSEQGPVLLVPSERKALKLQKKGIEAVPIRVKFDWPEVQSRVAARVTTARENILKLARAKLYPHRGPNVKTKQTNRAKPGLAVTVQTSSKFDPKVAWLCCFCNLAPHVQMLGDLFGPYHVDVKKRRGKGKSKREIWMHQDCALWAGNLVMVGNKWLGLEETLARAREDVCSTCGVAGAAIMCLGRNCQRIVHFPCAIRNSWKLDDHTFRTYCPAHIA